MSTQGFLSRIKLAADAPALSPSSSGDRAPLNIFLLRLPWKAGRQVVERPSSPQLASTGKAFGINQRRFCVANNRQCREQPGAPWKS